MKAVKCPVCEGSGKYEKKECHGCAGKGWVTVGMDYPPYNPLPFNPYPSPYPYYPNPWYPRWQYETGDDIKTYTTGVYNAPTNDAGWDTDRESTGLGNK